MAAAASSSSASAAPPTVLTQQRFAQAEQRARSAVTARATKPTPELHILGELCGATGFGEGVTVACKWALEAGDKWEWQEGAVGGQTQADCGEPGSDAVVWAHPLDVHFSAGALQGWPKLLLQVWRLDDTGRLEVEGYGFVHVPSAPGLHEVSVPTWRPLGTPEQELAAYFLGGVPRLKTTTVLFSSAHDQRFKHVTASAGTVHLRLEILLRHFDKHEIEAILATTPFWGGHVTLAVPLPPSSLGHPGAARGILEECLMRYHSVLRGFLVAFSGARFSASGRYGTSAGAPLGRIVAEQPVVHAHLEAQVLLFRPVCGQVLEGVVNRVSPHHVSCLVAGMFNASILVDDMAGGYSFVEGGAGAWRSTAVRLRACELEAAAAADGGGGGGGGGAGEGSGKGGGSGASSARRARSEGGGRNVLLASNPDTIEVGSTIYFRVTALLHSIGVLNMKGELCASQ